MVYRTGSHANQHLIFARLRVGNIFIDENFGATELMKADSFHKPSPVILAVVFYCGLFLCRLLLALRILT